MRQSGWKLSVSRIYDQVNLALWAALAASGIFLAVYSLPQIGANRANYEAVRQTKIEAENAFYCRRLGIEPGDSRYSRCLSELLQFRRGIEKQIAEEEIAAFP